MRVLIIDDEAKFARVLEQGLKEHGITAEVAFDGLSGLEKALARTFDAILLDVMLPGMNGFEVLKAIRAAGCPAPVLMLTARGTVDDRVRGLNLGADDYLPKPFVFKELLARLQAITRRPQVEPQTLLRAGDLEMDPQKREVKRGGQLIDLSTKEYALLELLLQRKGTVVTLATVMDRVWNSDYRATEDSNVVAVYITYLRKKIDKPFGSNLIQTVRGTGYLLREEA
ncbi:response regulator transcription factor [Mesoterricola silvestris]|uniref:DNA-binding response regulator n=1 Tax=Mesoterricola silvestris TaxID=2927979 RepID=A0AA48GRZ6_9BACT|nr:response regulator transcription factor [Mesoterricola silvestris]BDU73155.1 DNA-binding response regulator [Mesoterricola silvestris]